MARTVLPLVGAAVGFWVGGPTGAQIGFAAGSIIGGAVDPVKIQGPRLGETGAQTSAEGSPRAIIYGTISCTGNVIAAGPLVLQEVETSEGKGSGPVTSTEHGYRTYAIRICEGPVGGILRIWEDDKLVYDMRTGSAMVAESQTWINGSTIYLGGEDQLPDPNLETQVNSDMPAYRGTCYIVFSMRDLTDRRGSIPQYRFEVAKEVAASSAGTSIVDQDTISPTVPAPGIYKTTTGALGVVYRIAGGSVLVNGGFWNVREYTASDLSTSDTVQINTIPSAGSPTYWNGDGINVSSFRLQGGNATHAICMNDSTFGGCYLISGGSQIAALKPNASFPNDWWSNTGGAAPEFDGRRIWFSDTAVYVGTTVRNGVNVNGLGRWILMGGFPLYASTFISNICATPGEEFFTHFGNDSKMRIIADGELRTYSEDLTVQESVTVLPFATTNCHGFGIDGDVAVFAYSSSPNARLDIRNTSNWSLTTSISDALFLDSRDTRIVFTSDSIYIQTQTIIGAPLSTTTISRIPYIAGDGQGIPAILGDIVTDIHDRCKVDASKFDVSELTDEVSGLLLAGDYTGADAINTLRAPYFFDKYEADKSLWYPKRGANAAFVIDIDDLVEEPDVNNRQQAIEYPKKMHLQYQHANSGYAVVKATSSRSSPDARVIGEAGMSVPVVLTENEAAQTVAKMHKVAWTEADGSIELGVPDSFIEFTPTDVGSVTLRGQTTRRRIVKSDYADGVIRWTLVKDRQSAYTSEVEGVPVPDPTPPPATITGATVLAVMDISSRTDTEDDLNIYYGVTGAMPAWYGAVVQRSTDGGANYSNIVSINQASIIGYISGSVTDASEYFTDTTNVLTVTLYRDGQSLDSITDQQFLSEDGAFALEKPDGSWEIMQYRDSELDTSGRFILSTLHRGLLNSGTSDHSDGALFVMLDRPVHIAMPSSLIGVDLTHRAPSFEQSPELAAEQTAEYFGRSQIEWPIAYLQLSRNGTDISATWTPRHRFGTDDNPVASINFQGYRVTIDGGSNGSVTFDTTTAGFTDYDASALGGGLTVTVSALNRITGAGPSTSDII